MKLPKKISQQIPDEQWQKLPADLSKNLDHYLYGADKIEEGKKYLLIQVIGLLYLTLMMTYIIKLKTI